MNRRILQDSERVIQAKEQELKVQGFRHVRKPDSELKPFEYTITHARGSENSFEGSAIGTLQWMES